nr:zinc finger, CCHC-type [Tanacetum cinerariifolium]GEV48528.1 zinc finger, CCHC-type [Tanacetum cinerariifolium]
MASMNTRLNIVQKHGGLNQVGFKQLGPGVETGVHEVHDENVFGLRWNYRELKGVVKLRFFREQYLACKLFGYREDIIEAAFVVVVVEKIYPHESSTFNNTVACEAEIWATKGLLDKAKGNVLSMEVIKNQSGYTMRVSQSSLRANLQHMEALSTTKVGYMTFTEAWKKKIWLKGLLTESRCELKFVAGIATGALVKGGSRSEVPAQVEVAAYRMYVKREFSFNMYVKGACWFQPLLTDEVAVRGTTDVRIPVDSYKAPGALNIPGTYMMLR